MTAESLLDRLQGVRARGPGRWMGRCPAHADRSPSLSVREGKRALLIRCFAGCSIQEVCAALGLKVADLFADARIDPEAKRQRDVQRYECERRREHGGLLIDALREADATIAAACGIDISKWSDQQLDTALNRLADAYETLESEGRAHEQ